MKRRHLKRAASFLAVVCCLAGACIPKGLGTVTAAPRIVFNNEEIMSPDLYVVKEIECAVEGYEDQMPSPSNASFTFKLTVDGVDQENVRYTLYQCQTGQGGAAVPSVQSDDDKEKEPEVISYKEKLYKETGEGRTGTGKKKGEFTLQAGQMAKFYIGNKKLYRVEEVAMPERFSLARSENNVNYMGKSGAFAYFLNQWTPPETPGTTTTTLRVEKKVIFADGYQPPEDQLFLFRLEVMGLMNYEPCAGQTFTVKDADGESVAIPGKTDADGFFYLKGGCIADFEKVPTDQTYRVKEILTSGDLADTSQLSSRSAATMQSILQTGNNIGQTGENSQTEANGQTGATGQTEENDQTRANGQTGANSQTGAVDQTIANGQSGATDQIEVTVQTDQARQIVRNTQLVVKNTEPEQTSKSGEVSLNKDAVLASLTEYGWRCITDQERVVSTVAPLTRVEFTNINSAFVVSKELERREGKDDSQFRNTDFTFLLTKKEGGKNNLWSGAKYYLYDTSGNPVKDEASPIGQKTGVTENGTFTLKPGQAAVFYGIPAGTEYSVKEETKTGFSQSLPRNLDEYANQTVQGDEVNPHPFTNVVRDPGMLTVAKQVENFRGEAPVPGDGEDRDTFTFVLSKKDEEASASAGEDKYVPVDGAGYSIKVGGSTKTGTTKDGGRFRLENGETAEFEFSSILTVGDYQIQEVTESSPPGYQFNRVVWQVPVTNTGAGNIQDAESREPEVPNESEDGGSGKRDQINLEKEGVGDDVGQAGRLNLGQITSSEQSGVHVQKTNEPVRFKLTEDGMDVTYYNDYTPDRMDIVLTKFNNKAVGSDTEKSERLDGAEFRLYRVESISNPDGTSVETEVEVEAGKIYKTGENGTKGTITIQNLSSGKYHLKEIKAPDGYMIMDTIVIEVERSGLAATVKVNGDDITAGTEMSETGRDRPERKPCTAAFVSNMDNPDSTVNDQLTIYAYDDYLYELPHSGGRGIYWYLIGGVLLMMAASLILYKDKLKYAGRLR